MSEHLVILGGTGFIGSAIASGCSRDGVSCTALGSMDCDLTDPAACAERLPPLLDGNTVVYAGGIPRARTDTLDALHANLAMINNLVAAMREARPSRLLFLSTVEVYGIPRKLPIDEQTALCPRTLHGVGKVAAELMLRTWHDDTGTPLAVLRLPGVYGPADRGLSVVGKLVRCARSGQPFPLVGEGSWRRDYVWADDIARVVTALLETDVMTQSGCGRERPLAEAQRTRRPSAVSAPPRETDSCSELTLNVVTGRSLSIREVIDRVAALYGPVPLNTVDETGPDGHLEFDISRRRAVLPGVELTGLEEGLSCFAGQCLGLEPDAERLVPTHLRGHVDRQATFATDDILEVTPDTVEELKALAMDSPRLQSRLCMHHNVDAIVHEMINACRRGAYIRPHRHPEGKSESYHVIEGEMTVYFFDDEGRVVRRLRMGEAGSGATFLYRLSASQWHLPVPDSPMVVYHETFCGPFERDRDVEYAPWSPDWDDRDAVDAFLRRIEEG